MAIDRSTTRRRRGGFTLVEMMAVIGIMITVLFITLPALSYVRKIAKGKSVEAFMGTIHVAMGTYQRDHRSLPPSYGPLSSDTWGLMRSAMNNWEGANFLCQALAGPSNTDGKEGMGYVSEGVTVDAYLPSKDRVYDWNSKKFMIDFNLRSEFTNANRFLFTGIPGDEPSPILYYHKDPSGGFDKLNSARGIWGSGGQYNTRHNERIVKDLNGGGTTDDVKDYYLTQEKDGGANDMDREGLERALRGAKYLIIWCGVDFKYGTADDILQTGP